MEPIFITGFQRSGTTLLRLMLNAHPLIAIPLDTTGLWERFWQCLPEYGNLTSEAGLRRMVRDLLREERIVLWEAALNENEIVAEASGRGFPGIIAAFHCAYARSRGKPCWGDKDPGTMERLHLVHEWFPNARILHIIRDGRDACLSQMEQDFGYSDLFDCAAGWREQLTWVRRIGAILGPVRYFETRYEDLVREPELGLRSICGWLGIEYDPAMLEYHRDLTGSIPDSKQHIWPLIDQPPQPANAHRWKQSLSPAMRLCFEKRAGVVLRELGYDVLPEPWSGAYVEELRHMLRKAARAGRGALRRTRRLASRSAPPQDRIAS